MVRRVWSWFVRIGLVSSPEELGAAGCVDVPEGPRKPATGTSPGEDNRRTGERGTEPGDSGTGRRIMAPILGPFSGQKVL